MLRLLSVLVGLIVVYVAGIYLARLVFPLPSLAARQSSKALPMSGQTTLGRMVEEGQRDHAGKTGVLGISDGQGAIASRLLLARQAEASIDAQYYIWADDTSGRLLLKELYEAARRGVRVRLLLDDNGIGDIDATLAALDALDTFEVRVFNPSRIRGPKKAGYLFDLPRMNRRMHNKALVVDGAVAIVGGRNISDEYFRLSDDSFFIDLDVLAAGAVVPDTAAVFDAYWNSDSAYPMGMIHGGKGRLPGWITGEEEIGPDEQTEMFSDRQGSAADRFLKRETQMEWVEAKVLADDPAKGLGKAGLDGMMITSLRDVIQSVTSRLDVVSAYFIPGNTGAAYFTELARKGAKVKVLTNAYQTTDVKLVHAGYAKYRRRLLRDGVQLFELKAESEPVDDGKLMSRSGSSAASLHAKTLSVDDERIFVGSFNFDPRSALLNCEMGFLIDSPTLARRMTSRFEDFAPSIYAVTFEDGVMNWIETGEDGETIHTTEPGMSVMDRWMVWALGWLPIEWLL